MISTPPSEANAATAARTPTRRLRNFLPMNSLSPLIATGISPALDRPKFHKRNTIPVTAMSKTRKRMINTFQTSSPAGQPSSRDEIIASGRRGGLGVQAGGRARCVRSHGSVGTFSACPASSRALQVGTSAKAPVWWNERDGTVDILVGHDDVTWDFGVTVPLSTVHNLLAELGERPEAAPPPFGPTLFLALLAATNSLPMPAAILWSRSRVACW
jgi:hypothetical protein